MYDVTWERDILVPLADGTRLATDVYLPRGTPGPWPAILERTPYDKLGASLVLSAKYFASHGYAVVLQDVRGRFASEGEWYPFGNEGPDGVDSVGWVRAQPWCDGRVATIGLSYSSCTQTSLAALNPPGLAAQFVAHGFHNYHTASMRQGGALETRFFIYAFMMGLTSKEAMADPIKRAALTQAWSEVRSWLRQGPPKAGLTPLRHVPSYERWILDIWQHGEYDAYWRSRPAYSIDDLYDQHADVPIYLCGSWYDSYARSTVTNYVELHKRKKSPVRLIMGPWIHGGANIDLSYSGDAEFGPDAPLGYNSFRLRWFDAVLKGARNGIQDARCRGPAGWTLAGRGDLSRSGRSGVRSTRLSTYSPGAGCPRGIRRRAPPLRGMRSTRRIRCQPSGATFQSATTSCPAGGSTSGAVRTCTGPPIRSRSPPGRTSWCSPRHRSRTTWKSQDPSS
jgi:putative CocE/NonD family hydrolase